MRTSHARLVLVGAAPDPPLAGQYVPPYSQPAECGHPAWARCWLCCGCDSCGGARSRFEVDGTRPSADHGQPTLSVVG